MSEPAGGLYVGAISGTSMDGIDLALLEDASPPSIRACITVGFAPDLRQALTDLAFGDAESLDQLGWAHAALGEAIGDAINDYLAELEIPRPQIRAVGSHGQTVRHRPTGTHPFTLQIGDPNRIAERTGIDTVADFRGRDIAAGGQGAPLVPPFHRALFARSIGSGAGTGLSILNIGGIANLTVIPESPDNPMAGFDTGPGNALLDAWIHECQNQAYDADGAFAGSGSVRAELLGELLLDPYFAAPPPKSTGKEHFNLAWLGQRHAGLEPADVQATLAELTAVSVADAVSQWGSPGDDLVVCGGGRLNHDLMNRLTHHLPEHAVQSCEQQGFDGDGIEAAAFAWLAARHIKGEVGNAPEATGAVGPRILGACYPGR